MRFVLTPEERALVALRRAVTAYTQTHNRPDPFDLTEHPAPPPRIYFELEMDWSGRLMIEPSDVNLTAYSVCTWFDIETAAGKVEAVRVKLEQAQAEHDAKNEAKAAKRRPKAGDPRKGRKKTDPWVERCKAWDRKNRGRA